MKNKVNKNKGVKIQMPAYGRVGTRAFTLQNYQLAREAGNVGRQKERESGRRNFYPPARFGCLGGKWVCVAFGDAQVSQGFVQKGFVLRSVIATKDRLSKEAESVYNKIVKIEPGENSNPTVDTLERIAKALGVPIEKLFKE